MIEDLILLNGWKPSITVTDYSSDDFCVIQFRGGEYLITSAWCPPEYYRQAADRMLEINPNMKFGVITDDPENATEVHSGHQSLGHHASVKLTLLHICRDQDSMSIKVVQSALIILF